MDTLGEGLLLVAGLQLFLLISQSFCFFQPAQKLEA
jgi:hypothetical protein